MEALSPATNATRQPQASATHVPAPCRVPDAFAGPVYVRMPNSSVAASALEALRGDDGAGIRAALHKRCRVSASLWNSSCTHAQVYNTQGSGSVRHAPASGTVTTGTPTHPHAEVCVRQRTACSAQSITDSSALPPAPPSRASGSAPGSVVSSAAGMGGGNASFVRRSLSKAASLTLGGTQTTGRQGVSTTRTHARAWRQWPVGRATDWISSNCESAGSLQVRQIGWECVRNGEGAAAGTSSTTPQRGRRHLTATAHPPTT